MPPARFTHWPAELPARDSGQRVYRADLDKDQADVRVMGGSTR